MQPMQLVRLAAVASMFAMTLMAQANSFDDFPWNYYSATRNLRQQMFHDTSSFPLQGITTPVLINRLRWYANERDIGYSWAGGTLNNCWVDMSTAAFDWAAVTTNMASNHGPDRARVYTGNVTFLGGWGNGLTWPGPVVVDLAITPFFYDPNGGDLCIDCFVPMNAWPSATGTQLDVEFSSSMPASRVYNNTDAAVGTRVLHHATIVTLGYVPAIGLFPRFSANVTSGNSPLSVQFTDVSYSSDPGGITSWAWDVDGDLVTDYTTQNPAHVYTSCGTYSVSLTVTDSGNPAATLTKTNYITVDPVSAAFTAAPRSGFPPFPVQFTDRSTGPVTGWAWDFDGDMVTDSTVQNPLWVCATAGTFTVTLTVSNSCFSDSETKAGYVMTITPGSEPAPPELLQYQFNEVRGTSVANTASTTAMAALGAVGNPNWQGDQTMPYFRGNDAGYGMLRASYPASQNTVNTLSPLAITGDMTISWWQRLAIAPAATTTPSTFGGSGAAARVFTGGVAGTSLMYRGSPVGDIVANYNVQANPGLWEHVCLVIDNTAGTGKWYFNGILNTTTAFTPGLHAFTFTQFHWGYGSVSTTTLNYSRYYDMDDVRIYSRALGAADVSAVSALGENASAGAWGTTCVGTLGTPAISGNGLPAIGNTGFAVNLTNAEDGRLCAFIVGLTPAAFGSFDLSPWLGAGCALDVDWISANFSVTAGNAASHPLGVPNMPMLKGMHVYGQWLVAGTVGAVSRAIDINIE